MCLLGSWSLVGAIMQILILELRGGELSWIQVGIWQRELSAGRDLGRIFYLNYIMCALAELIRLDLIYKVLVYALGRGGAVVSRIA